MTLGALFSFAADASSIFQTIKPLWQKGAKDLYISSVRDIVKAYEKRWELAISFDSSQFEQLLPQFGIIPENGPILPETLDLEWGKLLATILLKEGILLGKDRDRFTQGELLARFIPAAHRLYSKRLFSSLPSDAIEKAVNELNQNQTQQAKDLAAILEKGFLQLRSIKHPGVHVLPEMVSPLPEDKRTKDVVVGRRVTINHLVDGRFFERHVEVNNALAALDQFLAERNLSTEPELYLFWIDGKSGSGKSVFLLQLLQTLILNRSASCFWLDDAAEKLPQFLEYCSQTNLDDPSFVFVDDFYSPQSRTLTDFKDIARRLRNPINMGVRWPIIITCGPPEHHIALKRNHDAEGFRVKTWRLSAPTKNESEGLFRWFKQRTGKPAKPQGAFKQERRLMISMLVELQHESIEIFGRKFADRLKAVNLIRAMTIPLALSRLYVWTPSSWLDAFTPEERDSFNEFNLDRDFTLLLDSDASGKYIRPTHPHLSDAIYTAIRPSGSGIQRAFDLAEAFGKFLPTDYELTSRLLRIFSEGGERIEGYVDIDELVKQVSNIWKNWLGIHESELTTEELLELWVSWAEWAANRPEVTTFFHLLDPFDESIKRLSEENSLWGRIWLRLWACRQGNSILIANAKAWLVNEKKMGEPTWSWVWEALITHAGHQQDTDTERLLDLGLQWLLRKEDRPDWNYVWRTALKASEIQSREDKKMRILNLGFEWLSSREDRNDWAHVWERLLEAPQEQRPEAASDPSLLTAGFNWLAGREDRPEWTHVWRRLVEAPQEQRPEAASDWSLLTAGFNWLAGREDRNDWAHVWERLLQAPQERRPEAVSDPSLLTAGFNWLAGREDRPEWTYVWERLLEAPQEQRPEAVSDPSLLTAGFNWLAGREDRPEWTSVWERLLEAPQEQRPEAASDRSLLSAGFNWLAGREDRPEWNYVWKRLLGAPQEQRPEAASDRSLLTVGFNWLAGREDRPEWTHVWERLLETPQEQRRDAVSDRSLLTAGFNWLAGREDRPDWTHVWEGLLQAPLEQRPEAASDRSLLTAGTKWLAGREGAKDWAFVWRLLLKKGKTSFIHSQLRELMKIGYEWLPSHIDYGSWSFIYEDFQDILLKEGHEKQTNKDWLFTDFNLEAFSSLGVTWLKKNERRPQIYVIVSKALRLSIPHTDNGFVIWARQWLKRGDYENHSWSYLWEALWMVVPSSDLVDWALSWADKQIHATRKIAAITRLIARSPDKKHQDKLASWIGGLSASALKADLIALIKRDRGLI